ncbi:hypothetical protein QBC36DRAFT_315440 [Triangularia setosa]|uniref:Uncharacterized protein n=1 Tax=Triangularia setosa TaxID=2587417 RepID=A0AAN7A3A3_9PEZI|nr:hypothetical protein QBC36DRAFT_315440 [Podospora setosa]
MDHYAYCLNRAMSGSLLTGGMTYSTPLMTTDDFHLHFWPLPTKIQNCQGVILDSRVTISVIVPLRLVQFLVKKVTFRWRGSDVQVTKVDFKLKPDNHGHMLMILRVNETADTPLRHASLPTTFELICLVMITAFANQVAWLDSPPKWKYEAGLVGRFDTLTALSAGSTLVFIAATAADGILLATGCVAFGVGARLGIAVASPFLSISESQQPKELLNSFKGMLSMRMEVLGVEGSPLSNILETPLTDHFRADMANADTMEILDKWQKRLADGLRKHPAVKDTCRIDPTMYWAKWLFTVAQIRIGIEGPSEAGKSELLTVLTGAAAKMFQLGFNANLRTMEIQMYKPLGRDAVFVDCPDTDDRNPLRILLSKADQLESNRRREEVFRNSLAESKDSTIGELRRLGELPEDFVIHSRQVCGDLTLLASEIINDIVQPFLIHGQMSLDGKRTLADCGEGEDRKIEGFSQFRALHTLADERRLWDIESLWE